MRVKGEARQYFLGYLWWLVEPMLYVAVFYFVFFSLLNNRDPEFLQFLMIGKLTFIWFSKSVNQAANSIEINKGLVAQVRIPQALFPIATVVEGFYRQSVVFAFLFIFLIATGYMASTVWLWLVPLIFLNGVLIAGCAMVAALLVCLQRDFKPLVQLGTVFLLFTSGVFWDIHSVQNGDLAGWLMRLNPIAVLIDAYRQVLLYGSAPDVQALLLAVVESAVILASMVIVFPRLQFWMAKRIITR